jgi:hypothetical protein
VTQASWYNVPQAQGPVPALSVDLLAGCLLEKRRLVLMSMALRRSRMLGILGGDFRNNCSYGQNESTFQLDPEMV